MEHNSTPQYKNVFEQIVYGLQTVNDNILDIYKMLNEIHEALQPNAPITPGASDKNRD